MRLQRFRAAIFLAACFVGVCSAQVADLSGTWRLNIQKSRWGNVQRPFSILVTVEHKEPVLKYSGTMVYSGGEDTRTFAFSGAIDGREYPITRSFGKGKIVIQRINNWTIEAKFRSDDGQRSEVVRTSLSRDGKVMRRSIRRNGPEGELSWTEVYERS